MKKLLVIEAAALGHELLLRNGQTNACGLGFSPMESVLPALTCPVQAGFRTALAPERHGMVANGVFDRRLHKAMFWEQSADLVCGERIWNSFRRRGGRVGMMFWQQSLGEDVDLVLSPAPIHRHHGGMIEDCYSRPSRLYPRLCDAIGRPFRLVRYWGPLASAKAGEWISDAASWLVGQPDAPHLLLVYLPSLDYELQRRGPWHPRSSAALAGTLRQIDRLVRTARESAYEAVVFGDYAIGPVDGPVFPNRVLAEAGLMPLRKIGGMLYCDLHSPGAFAMCDHQIAHVYVRGADIEPVRRVLGELQGISAVLDRRQQQALGLAHENSGELVLLSAPGKWLAYPWWHDKRQAPDYARHVDIHNKPGYDPCELFFGWPPTTVSQDTGRIRGSHGLTRDALAAWAATFTPDRAVGTLIDLAAAVKAFLD